MVPKDRVNGACVGSVMNKRCRAAYAVGRQRRQITQRFDNVGLSLTIGSHENRDSLGERNVSVEMIAPLNEVQLFDPHVREVLSHQEIRLQQVLIAAVLLAISRLLRRNENRTRLIRVIRRRESDAHKFAVRCAQPINQELWF